jgi:hypothetical protein
LAFLFCHLFSSADWGAATQPGWECIFPAESMCNGFRYMSCSCLSEYYRLCITLVCEDWVVLV